MALLACGLISTLIPVCGCGRPQRALPIDRAEGRPQGWDRRSLPRAQLSSPAAVRSMERGRFATTSVRLTRLAASRTVTLVAMVLHAQPSAAGSPKPAPFAAPFDTDLRGAMTPAPVAADEHLTVTGRTQKLAPMPGYDNEAAPWDAARAIRDPRTRTDTTSFGNAFNLGSPLGSDERSNETGGSLLAPRHP